MQFWGTTVRNGALVGIGLLSALAVYLGLNGEITLIGGVLIVLGGLGLGGLAWFGAQASAVIELLEESQLTEAEVQRKLMDALVGMESAHFATLGEGLNLSAARVAEALRGLVELGLFAGGVAWDSEMVYPREAGYLRRGGVCAHCDAPLPTVSVQNRVQCGVCGTVYADIQLPTN